MKLVSTILPLLTIVGAAASYSPSSNTVHPAKGAERRLDSADTTSWSSGTSDNTGTWSGSTGTWSGGSWSSSHHSSGGSKPHAPKPKPKTPKTKTTKKPKAKAHPPKPHHSSGGGGHSWSSGSWTGDSWGSDSWGSDGHGKYGTTYGAAGVLSLVGVAGAFLAKKVSIICYAYIIYLANYSTDLLTAYSCYLISPFVEVPRSGWRRRRYNRW